VKSKRFVLLAALALVGLATIGVAVSVGADRDNGWVVFVRSCGARCTRLYAVRPEGTGLRRLPSPSNAWAPAISPDGGEVAFNRGHSGSTSVWAVGDRGPYRIARQASSPAWSPDGRHIAYEQLGWLWVARADGAQARGVTRGYQADWSPADQIAFVRDGAIWLVRPDGSGLRRVTRGYGPAWSPDGRALAYWTKHGELRLADTRTGHSRHVATPGLAAAGAAADFSPDGKRIVFGNTVHLRDRLVFVHLDGSVDRVLPLPAADANDIQPNWGSLKTGG
jgi:Tol biopolymer transport system component